MPAAPSTPFLRFHHALGQEEPEENGAEVEDEMLGIEDALVEILAVAGDRQTRQEAAERRPAQPQTDLLPQTEENRVINKAKVTLAGSTIPFVVNNNKNTAEGPNGADILVSVIAC